MEEFKTPMQKCPYCQGEQLEEINTYYLEDQMTQEIICNDCQASWFEVWTFNYSDI